MITLTPFAAAITGAVLALWLGVAVWVTVAGRKRLAEGERAIEAARRGGELLTSAPAVFMTIDSRDRIQAGPRLAQWLGLDDAPRRLGDLEATLGPEQFAAFAEQIRAARHSARPIAQEIRLEGAGILLFARGGPAPPLLGGGDTAIVWLFDSSDTRSEIATLQSHTLRAERALDALSALIEAAPFPMWHRAPDLKLTLVNQAYVRAVEAENAADAIARGLELVDLAGRDSPQAVAARVREAGEPEERILPATLHGERRSIRVVDVPLGDAGVAGYAVDIEELEQARAELERFSRAQRDMLDLLSAGVAQFGPDRELVFYNQPFQRIFAMKSEWLADTPEFDRVLDRMRESERVPASRDFPEWKAARREWFRAGDAPIEENWLLPGGTHLRVVAQPLPDSGVLLIFEDRTEQIQLASARDTLLRVRTATFDNLVEGIAVFASDGRLHLWNRRFAETWQLGEEALSEHPRVDALSEQLARQFEHAGRAADIAEAVRAATADRQRAAGRFALKSGQHFEYAAVPLPDGNALFTLLDTTDSQRIQSALRERNEALETADRLKTEFVSNMSYELRTPLTSIAGYSEMLDGGYAGDLPEEAAGYVSSILESVGKLRTQIDEILDLAQSEAGGLPLARDEVDLKRLCEEAAVEARGAAGRRSQELVQEVDWSVGSVIGDALRLRQAVDHLLRNAIEYTPQGGRIVIQAEGDTDEARIIVSDNGPGIPRAKQSKMFDRFHRGAGDDKPRALGIGLPLTRQFVEAHGGTIRMLSEPGAGTAVTIVLPRGELGT